MKRYKNQQKVIYILFTDLNNNKSAALFNLGGINNEHKRKAIKENGPCDLRTAVYLE